MRGFGIGSIMPAGAAATPPAPGLVQNDQGQWGHYEILPGSELTTWLPYQAPSGPMPMVSRPNPVGDATQGTGGTGDRTQVMSMGTGDATRGMGPTGDLRLVPIPAITDMTLPNGYPTAPLGYQYVTGIRTPIQACGSPAPWATVSRLPSLDDVGGYPAMPPIASAGMAIMGHEITLQSVAVMGAVIIGGVAGYRAVRRHYRTRAARAA